MKKRSSANKHHFITSKTPPRRRSILNKKYRGGDGGHLVTHPTFSPQIAALNPQSYLPYNDFSNDPNYAVVDARLTAPMVPGGMSGGKRGVYNTRRLRRRVKRRSAKRRQGRKMKGGLNLAAGLAGMLSSTSGQVASPELISDAGGVAQATGKLAGIDAAYNSSPTSFVPIA